MSGIRKEAILEALRVVIDPDLNKDIVSLGFVKPENVMIDGGRVRVRVFLTTPACPVKEKLREQCVAAINTIEGVEDVEVIMDAATVGAKRQDEKQDRLPSVKNIIAVGSGKGGVGKSTVATNLAVTLAQTGAKVGLLDADIYGPSMPIMLGIKDEKPYMTADNKIEPIEAHGLTTISMGFLLKETDAVVWRGPMLGKALQQFIEDVEWGELDYLVVDLPPGTGDVQLTLSQLVPIDGAIVVTTPQDVAFADVRRAIRMFEMTHIPILGLVENMSYFDCPDNDKRYYIFGEGRTEKHASDLNLTFLGQLPLDLKVGPAADKGTPMVLAEPDGQQAQLYSEIAGRVAADLSTRHLDSGTGSKFKDFFKIVTSQSS
jgi:ATP-binding protein involved in chromosome partitioning